MKKMNGLVVTSMSIIALLFLFGGGMMAGGWGHRGWGMMGGPGGMMGGWGFSPFGWAGMLFMWLIPAGVIALIAFGVVALVKNAGNPTLAASQSSCSNCGKAAQTDWQNCPYCATALK